MTRTIFGAIIGDIAGSRFEFDNIKSKDFELLDYECLPTDDSYMTIAVANAFLKCKPDFSNISSMTVECMQTIGKEYKSSYGNSFLKWIHSENPKPYNSFGNGAAMRISPCSVIFFSLINVAGL